MEEFPKDDFMTKANIGKGKYGVSIHPLFRRDNESWKLLGKCLDKHINKIDLYVAENGSNTCDINMGIALSAPNGKHFPMFGYGLFIIPTPILAKVNKDFKTILVEKKWDEEDEEDEEAKEECA